MIDKVNNITSSNTQNKRSVDESRVSKSSGDNNVNVSKDNSSNIDNVKISQELGASNLSKTPTLDLDKVSAIKNALSRGDYPIDLEKVADALLQAYKDIKQVGPMLKTLDTSLQSLEKSFMLSYREVLSETNNLENVLNNFKDYSSKQEIKKSKLIKIANALEKISIKNEYKLNLLKEFPEYFSSLKERKKQ